jgi:hypothetical protein
VARNIPDHETLELQQSMAVAGFMVGDIPCHQWPPNDELSNPLKIGRPLVARNIPDHETRDSHALLQFKGLMAAQHIIQLCICWAAMSPLNCSKAWLSRVSWSGIFRATNGPATLRESNCRFDRISRGFKGLDNSSLGGHWWHGMLGSHESLELQQSMAVAGFMVGDIPCHQWPPNDELLCCNSRDSWLPNIYTIGLCSFSDSYI